MKDEIAAAVVFITRMVKNGNQLNKEQVDEFSDKLTTALVEKFKNHWYTDNPIRGQGYRCLRLNDAFRPEPLLEKVAIECGINYSDLNLPLEMTLWVDPSEVTCRFGETQGTWCTVAAFTKDQDNKEVDSRNNNPSIPSINPGKSGRKKLYRKHTVQSNKVLSGGDQFHWTPTAVNIPAS